MAQKKDGTAVILVPRMFLWAYRAPFGVDDREEIKSVRSRVYKIFKEDSQMKKGKITKLLAFSIATAMTATLMPASLLAGASSMPRGSAAGKFYTDFTSQAEATEAANALNVQINEEGTVLLKNENAALPGSVKNERISVFGYSSESIQGASGVTSLAQALTNVGFKVNPVLKAMYAGNRYQATDATTGQGRGELSEEDFSDAVKRSIGAYGDIAFVTVTRYGTEGTGAGDHKTVLDGKSSGAGYTSDSGKAEIANDEEENIGGWEHKALYHDEEHTYKHELMLSNEEVALLNYLKELKAQGTIKKIVYVLNSVVPIEMYNLEHDEDVDGILMISRPGQNGLEGVANVIAGLANPSGKTNQIYVRDYTADPIWYNVTSNRQTNADIGAAQEGDLTASKISYSYTDASGKGQSTMNTIYEFAFSSSGSGTGLNSQGLFGTDYEEDIYRDYMYYETVAAEMNKTKAGSGDAWYKENVVYPFGYGLSYGSHFEYEIKEVKLDNGTELTENLKLKSTDLASKAGSPAKVKSGTVTVKVTNRGSESGKEAVELYSQAAFNRVETPHVRMIAFEKTNELRPGASQTLKIKFNFQDIAAYDWRGSESGETGYVLEGGTYALHVMGNSNGWMTKGDDYAVRNFSLDKDAYLHLDDFSGNEIHNLFSDGIYATVRDPELNFQYNADPKAKMTLLSRKDFDGTFPQGPTKADMTLSLDALNRITYWSKFNIGSGINNFDEQLYLDEIVGTGYRAPNNSRETPEGFSGPRYQDGQDVYSKDGKIVAANTTGATKIVDGAKDFPWIDDYKAAKDEMASWTQAAAGTTEAPETLLSDMIGKDPYDEGEGAEAWAEFMDQMTYAEMEQLPERGETPDRNTAARLGIGTYSSSDGSNRIGGFSWASNGMVASTWNKDLAAKQGKIGGNLWLFTGRTNVYWGGAAQTIRSVWAGRNGEFHSTDSMLTGYMAAEQTKGLTEKGILVHIKHGILNDQSTPYNAGMITWISEQAIREIYAKSFQMAIQEGGANGFMCSYARIGVICSVT